MYVDIHNFPRKIPEILLSFYTIHYKCVTLTVCTFTIIVKIQYLPLYCKILMFLQNFQMLISHFIDDWCIFSLQMFVRIY